MEFMDAGVRGWTYTTIKQNYWRVAHYYEFEDLVQDSYIVFKRVCDRYPDVTEAKHRMALYKTSFVRHIHDLSRKRTRYADHYSLEADLDTPLAALREEPDGSQDPNVGLVVTQLPAKLQRMLTKLCSGERPFRQRLDGTRETTNERLCRLAGIDPTRRDIRNALNVYIHGGLLHPQYD